MQDSNQTVGMNHFSAHMSEGTFGDISAHLSDRLQRLVVNGQCLEMTYIDATVPRGSILGLLYFLLYINNTVLGQNIFSQQ